MAESCKAKGAADVLVHPIDLTDVSAINQLAKTLQEHHQVLCAACTLQQMVSGGSVGAGCCRGPPMLQNLSAVTLLCAPSLSSNLSDYSEHFRA